MTMTEKQLITSKEVQSRCSGWVESQQELIYSEDNVLKRKLDAETEEFIDTDSEFDSVSECGAKRRKVAKQMKDEILNLLCDWKDCLFDTNSMDIFVKHVATHIPQLEIKKHDDNRESYACSWNGCSYESNIPDDISKHVNYHSYHTKLKCIGSNIRGRVKLPVNIISCFTSKVLSHVSYRSIIIHVSEMLPRPRLEERYRAAAGSDLRMGRLFENVQQLPDLLVARLCSHRGKSSR